MVGAFGWYAPGQWRQTRTRVCGTQRGLAIVLARSHIPGGVPLVARRHDGPVTSGQASIGVAFVQAPNSNAAADRLAWSALSLLVRSVARREPATRRRRESHSRPTHPPCLAAAHYYSTFRPPIGVSLPLVSRKLVVVSVVVS
jgi:hypothetical protein